MLRDSDAARSNSARASACRPSLARKSPRTGTSPIYTIQTAFNPDDPHPLAASRQSVYGVISLIFWSVTIIVTLKYVLLVMRADNDGEGGIMALITLVRRQGVSGGRRTKAALAALGIFGASLFFGDCMITPAISVLSAVEGLADPLGTGMGIAEMFAHPFLRQAFLAGLPIAALAGVALSHVAFTGALGALAFGVDARLGLLAAPAGAAHRLTRNPYTGLALSAMLSLAATAAGLTTSYLAPQLPPSFSILAVASLTYAVTFLHPAHRIRPPEAPAPTRTPADRR